jgi:uncharacterized membrane protein
LWVKGGRITKRHGVHKGAALIAVTAIIVAASFMVAAVYYFMHRGTEVSTLERKYKTVREASLGGVDVFTKEIIPRAISGSNLSDVVAGFASITNAQVQKRSSLTDACFKSKLLTSTSSWVASCGGGALDPKTNPDLTFTLSGMTASQPFSVFAKIVDTVPGNSDTSGVVLEGAGTAETGTGMIAVQHFPYMYRLEVRGERSTNPEETSGFSVLYAY